MLPALLLGVGVLLASTPLFGVAIALVVKLMARVIGAGHAGESFWKTVGVMMLVTLVLAAAHLIVVALWAVAYLACEEISAFERAFYFSAQNYTALGYGDIVLSERWRLLGPLEAVNGLLLFGLSTAVMFAALSRLVGGRLPGRANDLEGRSRSDARSD